MDAEQLHFWALQTIRRWGCIFTSLVLSCLLHCGAFVFSTCALLCAFVF